MCVFAYLYLHEMKRDKLCLIIYTSEVAPSMILGL